MGHAKEIISLICAIFLSNDILFSVSTVVHEIKTHHHPSPHPQLEWLIDKNNSNWDEAPEGYKRVVVKRKETTVRAEGEGVAIKASGNDLKGGLSSTCNLTS